MDAGHVDAAARDYIEPIPPEQRGAGDDKYWSGMDVGARGRSSTYASSWML